MKHSPIRVLLIYPPSIQSHESSPMGMLMLAAVLEKAGCEVRLLDACAARKRRSIKEIVEFAVDLKPDVIGITLLTPAVKEGYKLAAALKADGFKLIAGGPHATLMPQEAIAHGFDAVVLGEGEPVIEQAVKALLGQIPKEQVPGWVYNNAQNQAVFTAPRELLANIDFLPFPAHHLVDRSEYGTSNEQMFIFSSRGCPARCSFCAGGLFGKHFRFRSPQNIIEEIRHFHKIYGTRYFEFVDDAMTVNHERIRAFCNSLIELQLPIVWALMTRVDTVDEDLLRLLSKARCDKIYYGVESGHYETLKRIHKPHTVEMVRKVVSLTAQYKIKTRVFFILGFPWESADDIQVTFDLMKELAPCIENFDPAIASILIPFPGTEIYDRYKDEYGFENWWLNDNLFYEQNVVDRQHYFERRFFTRGNVLMADFFHYGDDVRKKIYEIFAFMEEHNTKGCNPVLRLAKSSLLLFSRKAADISPALERAIFKPLKMAKKIIRG